MGFTDIEGTRVRAARYGFVGGKPSAAAAVVEIDGEEPCKRPEQLVFVDGPTYDLVGLTEEEYTEMVRIFDLKIYELELTNDLLVVRSHFQAPSFQRRSGLALLAIVCHSCRFPFPSRSFGCLKAKLCSKANSFIFSCSMSIFAAGGEPTDIPAKFDFVRR